MAQYEGSYGGSEGVQPVDTPAISGWAVGFTFFASMMLLLLGSFHLIDGFVAILNDTFYAVRPGYDLAIDTTAWGWGHILGGLRMINKDFGLMTGALWARILAIIVTVLSVIGNFYSIPYYPVWSIIMIVMGIGVIWALTAHGHDMAAQNQNDTPYNYS